MLQQGTSTASETASLGPYTDLAPAVLAWQARPSHWQILGLTIRKYILHKIKMIIIDLGKQLGRENKRFLSEWKKMSFLLEDIFTFYQKLPNSFQSVTRVAPTQIHCLYHPLCPLHPVPAKGSEEQPLDQSYRATFAQLLCLQLQYCPQDLCTMFQHVM